VLEVPWTFAAVPWTSLLVNGGRLAAAFADATPAPTKLPSVDIMPEDIPTISVLSGVMVK